MKIAANDNDGDYTAGGTIFPGQAVTNIPGVTMEDLSGKYFSWDEYLLTDVTPTTFKIEACDFIYVGPLHPPLAGIIVTIDQDGVITKDYDPD